MPARTIASRSTGSSSSTTTSAPTFAAKARILSAGSGLEKPTLKTGNSGNASFT